MPYARPSTRLAALQNLAVATATDRLCALPVTPIARAYLSKKLTGQDTREGAGKSSGVGVIYYYHDERMPLYLLTLFGKNEKANLSTTERNELAKLVTLLIEAAGV